MNTPDTEWVMALQDKARDYFLLWDKDGKKLRVKPDELFFNLIDPLVEELVTTHTQQIREERDTYWKERVESIRYNFERTVTNPRDGFNSGYMQACKTILKALTPITNEDNLK